MKLGLLTAPFPRRSLKQVADWIEGYRSFWERGFERMDKRLRSRER